MGANIITPSSSYERINELFQRLYLPFAAKRYPEILEKAVASEMSLAEFIETVLLVEEEGRDKRSARTLLKMAGLPAVKTVDEYDFSFSTGINKQQIMDLATMRFIEKASNVIFIGDSGVGKTHLSIALAYEATKNRIKTKFITAADLLIQLQTAKKAKRYDEYIKRVVLSPRLLVIDEIGYFPMSKEDANHFFQVISRRYERGSVVLSSNLPFSKWSHIFADDTVITTAILDRLLHHSVVINMQGESYRLKEKRKEGFMNLSNKNKSIRGGMPI